MEFTAFQIAGYLNGTIEGNQSIVANHPAKIEEATSGSICFLANQKYIEHVYSSDASIVVIDKKISLSKPVKPTLIWVSDAYSAFSKLLGYYQKETKPADASTYYISPSAQIGKDVVISPNCYIGDEVKIGDHSILYPNVSIYHHCIIGRRCIIHSGSVIGSDGFGFAPQADGSYQKIPQIGNVIIGDEVELGANVCIDRATMGSTKIGNGVKLDNLIQVAHNVVIEDHTVIAAQTGIAGSTIIKENCMIGGQVGIVGHIEIAAGSKIQAQSGVARSIKQPNKAWNDSPAFGYRDALKSQIIYRNLPELQKRIELLEQTIEQLKNQNL